MILIMGEKSKIHMIKSGRGSDHSLHTVVVVYKERTTHFTPHTHSPTNANDPCWIRALLTASGRLLFVIHLILCTHAAAKCQTWLTKLGGSNGLRCE